MRALFYLLLLLVSACTEKVYVSRVEEKYSFNYEVASGKVSSRLQVFDDGENTYIRVPGKSDIFAYQVMKLSGEKIEVERLHNNTLKIGGTYDTFLLRCGVDSTLIRKVKVEEELRPPL